MHQVYGTGKFQYTSKIDISDIPSVSLKKTDILSYGYGNSFRIWQKKDDIYPLKRIKFEGLEFNVPNNYKKYLKNIYGEWEKLPSESEIVTHNVQIKFKD